MSSGESFFNLLDYAYIALMGASCLFGMSSGFTRTFLSLCAWGGSGFLAATIIPTAYDFVRPYVPNPTIANVVASAGAYLICLVMLIVLARFISDMVKNSMFSGLDRALGLLFGLFRGIVLPLLITAAFLAFGIPKERYKIVNESQISTLMYSYLYGVVPKLTGKRDFVKQVRSPSKQLWKKLGRSLEELRIRY